MFVRRLGIQRVDPSGERHACPLRWIDSFAMRNFTADAESFSIQPDLPERDSIMAVLHPPRQSTDPPATLDLPGDLRSNNV